MPLTNTDAVILAGGLGTRLRSVVADRPKVLAPIGDRPFLDYQFNWLASFGVRRVVMAIGHLAGQVQTYVQSRGFPGLQVITSVESKPLGTGGAIRSVLPYIESETALVINGDSFTDADLGSFQTFHTSVSARLSLLLTKTPAPQRFGSVDTDNSGQVVRFREKAESQATDQYINAGVYLMDRSIIADIPQDTNVSVERDVFPRMCGQGLWAMKGEFPFIDIGTPESYEEAETFLSRYAS